MKTYKAKTGFVHRKVAGTDVLISVGANVAKFNGFIELNPTASLLWDLLQKEMTLDQLVQGIWEEFEVTEEVAAHDTEEFLKYLQERDMVVVCEG